MNRPVTYDLEYPLHLPENYANDIRPAGVHKNPSFIGNSSPMSESIVARSVANMTKPPVSQLINTTKVKVLVPPSDILKAAIDKTINKSKMKVFVPATGVLKAASMAHMGAHMASDYFRQNVPPGQPGSLNESSNPLDRVTDFVQQNKIINALSAYEGYRGMAKTLFQNPASGAPHLSNVPMGQANNWRIGIPGVSDRVTFFTNLPKIRDINPAFHHHGVTFKAPEPINKALNKITTTYSNKLKNYPLLATKVIPNFHRITGALPYIQMGAAAIDFATGKARRRAEQQMQKNQQPPAQMQQYQSSFKQDPYMGAGYGRRF